MGHRYLDRKLDGEHRLLGREVAIRLCGEQLTVVFADEPLPQYRVGYQPIDLSSTRLNGISSSPVSLSADFHL